MATRKTPTQASSRSGSRMVALLRGINVGKAKRIAMADLRRVFETLGYTEVTTILNSGNVVFTSTRVLPKTAAERIEQAIAEALGVESRVTLLTLERLQAMRVDRTLHSEDRSKTLYAVPRTDAAWKATQPLAQEDWSPESLELGDHWACLHCPNGVLKSRLVKAFEKAAGLDVTMRNAATMEKILTKARFQ